MQFTRLAVSAGVCFMHPDSIKPASTGRNRVDNAESPCAKEEVHEKEQYNRYSGGKCADDRAFCRARFL